MAIRVPISKDLSVVKTKILLNLTKRQLIFFAMGLGVAVPTFFLVKDSMSITNAVLLMMVMLFPFFMLAMYEKNGQPLEVYLKHYIKLRFLRPKTRPYQTNNYYDVLLRQQRLEQEVQNIVQGKAPNLRTKKSHPPGGGTGQKQRQKATVRTK